ncbi:Spy/CpxP family protein refolding chaperone [Paraburkholderia mimosarum]|uniref:Spy/CpxP family protein refolding chaperone n=1 Tax=Paraburkholderia mimosarum TaxID=312026 RepID=UPI003B5013D9
MSGASRLRQVLVCVAGIALGGTALADSSPRQDVAPQADCGRWGYGPGPGMMGGAGYGAGMMGYGAGPGMMRGYGMGMGPGMGPGAMMSGGWASSLDLTDEQRTKINQIQDQARKNLWVLMGSMMDQQATLRDLYQAPKRDNAAIDESHKAISALRQKMIDSSIDARKRVEAVLTRKQLDKLRTYENQADELGW